MRYKIDDEPNDKNGKTSGHIMSIKNVEDLPEELQQIIGHQASVLAKSLHRGSARALEESEADEDRDELALVLTPFVMELAYLKINVATAISAMSDLAHEVQELRELVKKK